MKRRGGIVVIILIVIGISYISFMNEYESRDDADFINDDQVVYEIIEEERSVNSIDFNGHVKNRSKYDSTKDKNTIGKPWPYIINGLGVDRDDNKELIDEIHEITRNLAYNEYHCVEEGENKHLLMPYTMSFKDENLVGVAEMYGLDQLKIENYKITEIGGDYEYRQSEIFFKDGQSQTLEIDMERFYPNSIKFENDEGKFIYIHSGKHTVNSCHTFYHADVTKYRLLETDYLTWHVFGEGHRMQVVSFQSNENSQYDLYIYHGLNVVQGDIETSEAQLNKELNDLRLILNQLGDLSQLNTKRIGFLSSVSSNNPAIVTQYSLE